MVLTVARRSSRSECSLLCALWLTLGGTYVSVGQYNPVSSVMPLAALWGAGRYYFLGPYQPTEVTNRPLNINLIKNFRKYENSQNPFQNTQVPLLELLESCTCGVDNKISKDCVGAYWIFNSVDI